MFKSIRFIGGMVFLSLCMATPSVASAARVQGVDVSSNQFNMNWQTTYNAGIRFAFVRATRGGPLGGEFIDASTASHMTGAGDAGILRGAYHYSRPSFLTLLNTTPGAGNNQPTTSEITAHALSEANFFYANAGQYMTKGFLRPVLDLEENVMRDQNNQPDPFYEPLTATNMTLWAETFIDRIGSLTGGVEPIVYMNSTFARDNFLTSFNQHDLWLARYSIGHPNSVDPQTSNPETPGGFVNPYGIWNVPIGGAPSHDSWTFWQYSNAGVGSTYGSGSTFIDLDLFNGSMAQLQAFVIPEPGAMTMAGSIVLLGLARRRRR